MIKMIQYTEVELEEALKTVIATIANCEKMLPKFMEGTSQNTLLKNRISALMISKNLMESFKHTGSIPREKPISVEEKEKAMPPILSIIHKCERARAKAVEGTTNYKRLTKTIEAMKIAETLLNDQG